MHVNTSARHALRAMMHLATLPPGEMIRARDLSRATGVPPAYLSKVMGRLVARRLLHAVKGHGGGYRLSRAAGKISIAEVFEAAAGKLERDLCVIGDGRCHDRDPCPLHDSWSDLNDAFHAWSRQTTLQQLTKAPSRKR